MTWTCSSSRLWTIVPSFWSSWRSSTSLVPFKSFLSPSPGLSAYPAILYKMDRKLLGWRAGMLSHGGHAVFVKSVLSSVAVHSLLATDTPRWFGDAINKKQRCFFWKGRSDVQKGHCVGAWARVCLPVRLGCLGVRDANLAGASLQLRRPWLQRINYSRPWASFKIHLSPRTHALFSEVCKSILASLAMVAPPPSGSTSGSTDPPSVSSPRWSSLRLVRVSPLASWLPMPSWTLSAFRISLAHSTPRALTSYFTW